jgi:hypothetical protein
MLIAFKVLGSYYHYHYHPLEKTKKALEASPHSSLSSIPNWDMPSRLVSLIFSPFSFLMEAAGCYLENYQWAMILHAGR